MKLIDKQDRKKLAEGRDYGIGYAFCKFKKDTFTTVGAISPCKDFLNDQVYSEATGKPYKAYGYNARKKNIFVDNKAYLAMSVCLKGGTKLKEYPSYEIELNTVNDNYLNMAKAINFFEEAFNVNGRTEIHKLEENRYGIIAPSFWTEATYLISLYTLLLRMSLHYKEGDVMKYYNDFKGNDSFHFNGIKDKLKKMMAGNIPKQDFSAKFYVHGCGIVDYSFPV